MSDSHADQIAKLNQTIAMLEEQQHTLGADLSLAIEQTRQLLAKLEQVTPSEASPLWGVKLNHHTAYSRKRSKTLPEGCPSWAKPMQIEDWDKRGLIVWNDETHQFHKFWAEQALSWLDKLRAQDDWRTAGIVLTQTIRRQIVSATPQPKPARKKEKGKTESLPIQEANPKYENLEEECVKLPVGAGDEFFTFLASHEATLREMATEDEKERSRVLGEVYGIILEAGAKHKAAKVDLAIRPLQWLHSEDALEFVCDRPPNRATVSYIAKAWSWQASIEQPHQFKHENAWIHEPEEALTWAEKELLLAEKEQATPEDDEPLAVSTVDLTPFWIDPATLEPKQVTYSIVIFIEHEPISFKTMEMSFGELMQYDKEYPRAQALARELEIDTTKMQVTQLGPDFGFYNVKSNVTYFKESLAAAQAQAVWDKSRIVDAFQKGKIIRAYYGYAEVETGYKVYLGSCQKPEATKHTPGSRVDYLAKQARRQTLLNALDVDGFRAHIRLQKKYISDEDLLVQMHEERAESPYLSPEVQAESRRWLNETAKLTKDLIRQRR
jgi:hypothetical protein